MVASCAAAVAVARPALALRSAGQFLERRLRGGEVRAARGDGAFSGGDGVLAVALLGERVGEVVPGGAFARMRRGGGAKSGLGALAVAAGITGVAEAHRGGEALRPPAERRGIGGGGITVSTGRF